jgi:PAS domain S-box-containing protein
MMDSEFPGRSRDGSAEPKARILLVDDNPANLLSLQALLEDLDVIAVKARSGEEAVERIQDDDYAVVLLDVLLPGLSGFETARAIRKREQSRHTPIIFLTASDIDRPQLEEAYRLGAVDFLGKPLLPIAVRAKVRGFVELFQDRERARREADQLRLLVHGTTDYAIFLLDPEGHIVTWNPGAERLKGYRAEEIIGRHFSQFYPQDAIDRGWPAHELKVATAEGRFEDEGWRLRKDGTPFWANVVITALHDASGKLRGFSKITRDLTERKRAEASARQLFAETTARQLAEENARLLQEQRERLRVTLESIGDAVISTDAEGRVEFLNPVAQDLTGWGTELAARHNLTDVFHIVNEDTRQPVENPALRAIREGGVVGLANHTVLVARDGTERPIDDSAAPIKDAQGRVVGSVLVFRDITEKQLAQQQLREQQQWLSVTLSSIGDAVIATDTEGRVTFLNPVAEGLTGWSKAEAEGRPLEEVFAILNEHSRRPVANPVQTVLREGVTVGLANHTVLVARDGTERPIDDSAAPIRDTAGKLIGVVLTFRDVTEPRRAEQHRNARLLATHALSQATTVDEGAAGVLQAVGESLAWEVGFVWTVNEAGERLLCRKCWRRPDLSVNEFETSGCDWSFAKGEGLPGRVWATGQPAWILDVSRDANFHRLALADRCGLRSAFACPIVVGERTLGVIEFFTGRVREADEALLEMMATVAGNLGQFLDRQGTDEELRQSEQRFRQLADAMPQIVWTAQADGNIDYLNRRWTEFTGLPQTASNEGWGPLLHPEDARPAGERWAACVRSGDPFEMPIRLRDRREQTYRWHLLRTVAIKDAEGRVVRWYGTATDIHEQKRDEEAARYLAEASAALAELVDQESTLQKVANLAVPHFADWSAVDVANNDGSLRRLAVAHQDLAKIDLVRQIMREYPPDPQSPVGVYAVLRTGKPEFVTEITDEMLAASARDERHLELIRSLGLRSFLSVPLIVSGETFGVLTFATAESGRKYTDSDLTQALDLAHRAAVAIENTRLYQALREADQRKDEFLATLAHELRNPLAPIRNSLQILRMPRVDAKTIDRLRDMLERQVHHLVRLVDDLLDVSRVMRGKIELRRERVELATVVASAVETVQPLLDSQGHQLRINIPSESLPLGADPVRLTQVVTNLLTNAAKYTEQGGRIELTAERAGNMAVLRIRDTGIGIAPHMLPRIFELFVQVDTGTSRSQGGLGIGLTLVKNLVEMHNGTVQAHSEGLGKGSEFTVRLPLTSPTLTENQGQEVEPQVNEEAASSGLRLLVVDDNEDAADSLALLLQFHGHHVRVAYSGMAALEITKRGVPDLVFLDIGMPGMDGYEVARRLRQQPGLEKVLVAALTGWGQQEDRRRSAEAGFDYHLVKPVEPKTLESLLANLKLSRQSAENKRD